MRIALTGASGFTGRYVAAAAARAGMTVFALDADVRDPEALRRAVARDRFDCLIHLAGKAFTADRDWEAFYAVNQIGTFNLLEAVADHHPGARCIVAGSAQVYGPGAEGLIAEDAPLSPSNHYALSKMAVDKGVGLWRDRLDIVVTRPFNYTGVDQEDRYLIPKLVDHFRRRAPVIELGNTWVKRDFGDVRAVAEAYLGLAAGSGGPAAVNLASGTVRSIDDILAILTGITGHEITVRVNPAFVRKDDVPVLGGDIGLLRSVLPTWTPIDMRDTLSWMLESGNGEAPPAG